LKGTEEKWSELGASLREGLRTKKSLGVYTLTSCTCTPHAPCTHLLVQW